MLLLIDKVTRKFHLFGGIGMSKKLTGVLSILIIILLSGCQEKVTPEDRLAEYVVHWNEGEFADMYSDYLNKGTKDVFETENFVERQEKIHSDFSIENVEVTYTKPKEDTEWNTKEPANFDVQVKMDTVAGPVEFEKTMTWMYETHDETENWFVEWDTSFIFPELGEKDAVGIYTSKPVRGGILDRNGLPIAINGKGEEVGVVPEKFADEASKTKLAELLGTTVEYIDRQLNQGWVRPSDFVPISKVAKHETVLLEQAIEISGVTYRETPMREYPYGEALSHLSGYIGVITAEQLEKRKDKGYTEADLIGREGMEQLLEDKLRGTSGVRIYIQPPEKEAKTITVAEKPAVDGETISLTIDAELQKTTYEAMKGEAGNSAAVDPNTGEMLALVSSPGFDPSEMMLGISGDRYKELQENPLNPLLARFTRTYAPGSTLKPMTAAIGMEAGTLDPAEGLTINGKSWQKDESWDNYRVTRVHDEAPNPIDLNKALVYSDNIYFAQQALDMGSNTFVEGLKNFGFGEEIPFVSYLKPSQISTDGKLASLGQLADTSFGQGEMLTNIVHLASMYEVFITDGVMYKPTLLLADEKGQVWKDGLLSAENAASLRTSLRNVIVDGFAQEANLPSIPLAGKTGTTELKAAGEVDGKQNGFFVAYNSENPTFILAMMIESVEDNGGSAYVAELASTVFKKHNK